MSRTCALIDKNHDIVLVSNIVAGSYRKTFVDSPREFYDKIVSGEKVSNADLDKLFEDMERAVELYNHYGYEFPNEPDIVLPDSLIKRATVTSIYTLFLRSTNPLQGNWGNEIHTQVICSEYSLMNKSSDLSSAIRKVMFNGRMDKYLVMKRRPAVSNPGVDLDEMFYATGWKWESIHVTSHGEYAVEPVGWMINGTLKYVLNEEDLE